MLKVGDRVYCKRLGRGTVSAIDCNDMLPITIVLDSGYKFVVDESAGYNSAFEGRIQFCKPSLLDRIKARFEKMMRKKALA